MTNMFGNTPTKEEIEQLTEERDAIFNSKNNSQIELEQVQAKLADVITEIDTQKDMLSTHERDVDSVKEDKDILLTEVGDLENEVRSLNKTVDSLKNEIETKEVEIDEAEKDLSEKLAQIDTGVVMRREEANGIILDLDKQIIDREKTTNELAETIVSLREEIVKKTNELEETHEELAIATEKMTAVEIDCKTAESDLEKIKLQIVEQKEAQAKKLIDIEAAITALEEQKTIVVTELKEEIDRLTALQTEVDTKTKELKKYREMGVMLSLKEERIREFCDENGIDHSNF